MKSILVVEDDTVMREFLVRTLSRSGYLPRGVTSGEEVASIAASRLPDAILLDVGLPGIDGWEVLKRLQEDPNTARIPVVLLTCHDAVDDLFRGYASGATFFIAKPCREEEILRSVRIALATHGSSARSARNAA